MNKPKIKKLNGRCLVCRKKIRIKIYKDGHYTGAHYFNKLKIPIKGTGIYKKIGTTKLLGKKINVVKWTGREKEIEYWECNSCFEEATHEDWLEMMIRKLYGKKCQDYIKECACCQAWGVYQTIIDENLGRL